MATLAEIKARARKAVHAAFSVSASHRAYGSDVVTAVQVRWHNKLVLQGNGTSDGYASVIEGIDRMVFDLDELAGKGIALDRGDTITMGQEYHNAVLVLEEMEPMTGPVEQKWWVARK
jgi:hypothetical protein